MNFKNCIVWHAVKHISEMMFFFLLFMHGDIWTIWLKHFYHIGKHDSDCQHVWLSKNDLKMIMAIQPFFYPLSCVHVYRAFFFLIKNQAWTTKFKSNDPAGAKLREIHKIVCLTSLFNSCGSRWGMFRAILQAPSPCDQNYPSTHPLPPHPILKEKF